MFTLTHLFPIHPFSTPWKNKKIVRFSDFSRGKRKGALETSRLNFLQEIQNLRTITYETQIKICR